MNGLDYWDAALIAGATLVAVSTLVRLMRSRRNLIIAQVRQQFAAEQARIKAEEKKRKKKEQQNAA